MAFGALLLAKMICWRLLGALASLAFLFLQSSSGGSADADTPAPHPSGFAPAGRLSCARHTCPVHTVGPAGGGRSVGLVRERGGRMIAKRRGWCGACCMNLGGKGR